MGSFLERIKQSDFLKNIATLMFGSGLSQIIPFLLAPILARLYTPAQFGIFATYISIVVIISGISTGRYELAIVIAKTDREAAALAYLSMGLSLAVSFISLIILRLVQFFGVQLYMGVISESWVYLVPFFIWIYALFQIFRFIGIRNKKFKSISAASITDSSSRGGVNILLGYTIKEAFGLIIGGFVGVFSSVLILLFPAKKFLKSYAPDWQLIKQQAVVYKKFPIYDVPSTLFYSFGNQGVVVLMTRFLGETVVGIYSYTERILITPISFLSNAFSQVFFQKSSEYYHNDVKSFSNLLAKTMKAFILFGIIPFAIFAYTSVYYIPILLGDQWLDLYKYVYILSPYIFMIFISSPLSHVLKIINRQEYSLILKIIFFSLRIGALFFGYWLGLSHLWTLYYFSIFSVLSLMISLVIIHILAKVKINWSVWLLTIINIVTFVVLYDFISNLKLL
ncbi:MAG: hypothetical protein DSY76_02365 [Bacteroidetes bacterium]|nr:MAG: hypothetical protein DSY76_02365 [Bacteroidota bacterium]